MGRQGRLLLQPVLTPAWPASVTLWSRSNSGRVSVAATGRLSLDLVCEDGHQTAWPDLGSLIPALTPGSSVTALIALDHLRSYRILLGFDNGIVAVIDSDRALLFCHVLHRGRVLDFRCRRMTPDLGRPDIIVRFGDRLIFLDGSSFVDVCNQRADDLPLDHDPEHDPLRYVQYQKISVAGQTQLLDVAYCDASLTIGHRIHVDPHKFQLLVVGAPSFNMIAVVECSRHRPANEVITDAVRQSVDAARKLASNFFAFGRKMLVDSSSEISDEKSDDGNEAPSPGRRNFIERASTQTINPLATIGDVPNRLISCIVTDKASHWAACVDNLGRLLLLDVRQFLFVRIWKGYRDAQVAFVQDDDGSAPLMLVIYLSSVELLELWDLPFGDRVAAKRVGRGHLLRADVGGPILLQADRTVLSRVALEIRRHSQLECSVEQIIS